MDIKLFNGLHHRLETFVPIRPGHVSMYVCGPTVYDYVHIGNLRPVVVFDVLKKLFIALGYQVKHVSNYTDIDDRIIDKAIKENLDEKTIAKTFIEAYQSDVAKMNASLPDATPTVSEHLPAMIEFISDLITKEFAYITPSGDVFFRVRKIKDYGRLSHIDLNEIQVGARVEENQEKEDPLDFALWKHTSKGITFPAPFGEGRPGWHTECVVMIHETFKQSLIDIHGGGFDLKFPHHENEIAQSQAIHQNHLANYWVHNGFINLNAEKMSKSTGNIFLAKDFLSTYEAPLLRYLLLATHYRMPVNITGQIIENTQQELLTLQTSIYRIATFIQLQGMTLTPKQVEAPKEFLLALCDDINTANALTVLHQYVKSTHSMIRDQQTDIGLLLQRFLTIQTMLSILGLFIDIPILTLADQQAYQVYLKAKQAQDFKTSDTIRTAFKQRHILI